MKIKRVLIAEDESYVVQVLRVALERAGYKIISTPDGKAALNSIITEPPDVLIVDIQMPIMSGKELCLYIDDHIKERNFLIIILTSRTEVELRDWTNDLSNMVFLEKPVSIRKLISLLDVYFEQQNTNLV